METKSLLFGLIGFFIGGLLVSIAATTFDKPGETTMSMAESLKEKTGDEFDKAFLNEMIIHHQDAVAMSKLVNERSKHPEIKTLSEMIITAQEKEISEMMSWQAAWGYKTQIAPKTR